MMNIYSNKNTLPYYILTIIFFLYLYIYLRFGLSIILTKNVYIQFTIWICTIIISLKFNNNYLLLAPIIIVLLNEILYYKYNIDLYDGVSRTKTLYNIGALQFNKKDDGLENLTEGVYINENGKNMSIKEAKLISNEKAEEYKFIEIFKALNINHLSKNELKNIFIIDMGCGFGEFVKYCISRGVSCIGVTITEEQFKEIQKRNLPVILGDYRNEISELVDRADIITFNGSLEHITSGKSCHIKTEKKQYNNFKNILEHCKKYFKKDSPYKKIFGTNLHINPKVCNSANVYFIERAYGGTYFYNIVGKRIPDIAASHGFKILNIRDMTYHYYLASVVDENHFGVPGKLTFERILAIPLSIFINPHIIILILYTTLGCWMWQFSGKYQYAGENFYFENNVNKRPTTLLHWTIQQK